MTRFGIANQRGCGPRYNSKTRQPVRAYYNRMCWSLGRRLTWEEFSPMLSQTHSFLGKPLVWRAAFCGPRSVWLDK